MAEVVYRKLRDYQWPIICINVVFIALVHRVRDYGSVYAILSKCGCLANVGLACVQVCVARVHSNRKCAVMQSCK